MSTELLENGPWTLPVTLLGVVLLVAALGVWVGRDARRPSALLALAGLVVLGLSVVVGWVEESRDVDKLRAALQERGVAISTQQAREVRDTLNSGEPYAAPEDSPRDWSLAIDGGELVLRLVPVP